MSLRSDLIARGLLRPSAEEVPPGADTVQQPSKGSAVLLVSDGQSNEIPSQSIIESEILTDEVPVILEPVGIEAAAELPENKHFSDIDAFREAILTLAPSEFISRYVFEPVPFAFNGENDAWLHWKTSLAKKLDVDPREIILAGSGALGFSLNPKKSFRPYGDHSDIDVGVISRHHFDVAWWTIRRYNPLLGSHSAPQKKAFKQHRSRYVFDGSIATDQILPLLPFGPEWKKALDEMSDYEHTSKREVKLRIYRDFESLRSYQMSGVGKLRTQLAATGPDELPITEDIK